MNNKNVSIIKRGKEKSGHNGKKKKRVLDGK